MWELNHEESWAPEELTLLNCGFQKTFERPCKEIKPVNPKGNQSWIFIGRTDAEADAPVLWPPDAKNWLTGKFWPCCWERLKVGEEGEGREWDGWMASPIQWSKLQELVMDREAWHAAVHRVTKSWTRLSDWSEYTYIYINQFPAFQRKGERKKKFYIRYRNLTLSSIYISNSLY